MSPEQITLLTNGGIAALAIYLLFQERKERINVQAEMQKLHLSMSIMQTRYRREIIAILLAFTGQVVNLDKEENEAHGNE